MHSDRHEELLSLAALGVPLGDDARDYEQLLAERCPVCEELFPELREAAAALGAVVPARTPRPELRAAVMASLGPARRPVRSSSSRAGWLFAAAAAALFVLIALDDARLRRGREALRSENADLRLREESARSEIARRDLRARVLESDDVRMLFLGGHGPQPDARAKVFWSPGARRGVLLTAGLAPLPPDRQYQLWVFVGGKPVDAGVFDADPSGKILFESKELTSVTAENFAVTVEPRGGLPQPSGPIVLLGSPSAG
jgi:anti-sigma-K factor RskA